MRRRPPYRAARVRADRGSISDDAACAPVRRRARPGRTLQRVATKVVTRCSFWLSIAISAAWYCTMAVLASPPSVRRLLVRRKAVLDTAAGLLLMGVGGRMLAGR